MEYRDAAIAWNPVQWGDVPGKAPARSVRIGQRALMLFSLFNRVVLDGVDPRVAHREFLKLKEYRFHIAPDVKGAEGQPAEYERLLAEEIKQIGKLYA